MADAWLENSGITRIYVDGLFGQYRYDLVLRGGPSANFSSRIFLLYGDNGAGKTTILKMVFYMLSHIDKVGHKTRLGEIPFKSLQVDLANGFSVAAAKDEVAERFYTLSVMRGSELVARASYPTDSGEASASRAGLVERVQMLKVSEESDARRYRVLNALKSLDLRMLWVTDRRKTRTTLQELRRTSATGARFKQQSLFDDDESSEESRDEVGLNLKSALEQIGSWATGQALSRTAQGDQDVNTIYASFIEKLSHAHEPRVASEPNISQLISNLQDIEERSLQYSRFGLTQPLKLSGLVASLQQVEVGNRVTAVEVLQPYVDSLHAKYSALEPIMRQLSQFSETLRSFYSSKKITLNVRRGLQIRSRGNETLSPAMLSSGEGQLLYLLACTLMARERASLFIIDEPEISLNVRWQRQLLTSLLNLTEDSKIQFLMATHSIELLTSYSDFVVDLNDLSLDEKHST